MIFETEYTDTFAGQANYSWVRRRTFEAPAGASDRTLMRRARVALGLQGVRGRLESLGDSLQFRPYGECTIVFISPSDEPRVSELPVIFRMEYNPGMKAWECLAIFPTLGADLIDPDTVIIYRHVGQHGSASLSYAIGKTRPASPEESAPLLKELQARYESPEDGNPVYMLKPVTRCIPSYGKARRLK